MHPGPITFRTAGSSDSARVAELHAASWQSAYRGFLSEAYLDTDVPAERLRVRLRATADSLETVARVLAGLGCPLVVREPPELGVELRQLAANLSSAGCPRCRGGRG